MNKLNRFKRNGVQILAGLVVVFMLMMNAVGLIRLGFAESLENYTYDLRLRWTMPNGVDKRFVIVDIDEKSLKEQGQWPWPRNTLAHLVDQLFDRYKIDVLGFDILFAERDVSSGLSRLEALASQELRDDLKFNAALDRLRPGLNYDQIFADSLKNRRVVLGYYFRHDGERDGSVGKLPQPAIPGRLFIRQHVGAKAASGFAANLPELQTNAVSGGYFNISPLADTDGVFRRVPMLQVYDGDLYETLGLAVARLALRETTIELGYADGEQSAVALEFLQVGKRRIPVDSDVAALIPYRGKQGSFPYVSASDVLQGKVPVEILRGAIVLVGTTAPGLKDLRTTPMQDTYAGVEAHTNLAAGVLDGNIKERPAYTLGFEVLLLLLAGLALAFGLPFLDPLRSTMVSISALVFLVVLNLLMWEFFNLVLPLASMLLLVSALFVTNMSYGFFIESRGKRALARRFGQYVPPELVEKMAEDPGAYTLEGESRQLTVLFSDVRGFTTISEGLGPRQLTQLINEFLTPMTEEIHRHLGTIDKYMGDAILAFWGAPVSDDQHARNAMLAAMDMIARLDRLQDSFKARGWPPIKIGIGINTGEMTVGNMGSEFRLTYTVMGDAVNLGSRLEGLTKVYGVQIIVSEYTRAAVPDFEYQELDFVCVKGRDKPVRIFQPMGLRGQLSAEVVDELRLHLVALRAYRNQQWQMAEQHFGELQRSYPDRLLYGLYAKRIAAFQLHPPPPSWDGSFVYTSK